jgi:S-disulfanyl-L-cysteine oxidoreductase SoxD
MRRNGIAWLFGVGLGAVLFQDPILAQQASPQVTQGRAIYAARCANCHGSNGEGDKGPSLVGENHNLSGYGTADVLYDYTRQVMPADRPGRLLEVQYWAVLAYILDANGLLPPGTTLGRANAQQVALDR